MQYIVFIINENSMQLEFMANSLFQFKIDKVLLKQANDLCAKLSFDLSTYLRLSLIRNVQEQCVPFSINLNNTPSAE